jgi:hypothetical protein
MFAMLLHNYMQLKLGCQTHLVFSVEEKNESCSQTVGAATACEE